MDEIPCVTTRQMIEVDRAMTVDLGVGLIQMMENAGRNLAHLARGRFLGGDPRGKRVVVMAGAGGNGGGALVAARRLHMWGARVAVVTARRPPEFTGVPGDQLHILQRLGVTVGEKLLGDAMPDLIVDGIIGYGLSRSPAGAAASLIAWANSQPGPVVALDVPSGLDATSGEAFEPTVRATATMTLALPKTGLLAPVAAQYVGELYLADIGVPPEIYAAPALGLRVGSLFARDDVIRLR